MAIVLPSFSTGLLLKLKLEWDPRNQSLKVTLTRLHQMKPGKNSVKRDQHPKFLWSVTAVVAGSFRTEVFVFGASGIGETNHFVLDQVLDGPDDALVVAGPENVLGHVARRIARAPSRSSFDLFVTVLAKGKTNKQTKEQRQPSRNHSWCVTTTTTRVPIGTETNQWRCSNRSSDEAHRTESPSDVRRLLTQMRNDFL